MNDMNQVQMNMMMNMNPNAMNNMNQINMMNNMQGNNMMNNMNQMNMMNNMQGNNMMNNMNGMNMMDINLMNNMNQMNMMNNMQMNNMNGMNMMNQFNPAMPMPGMQNMQGFVNNQQNNFFPNNMQQENYLSLIFIINDFQQTKLTILCSHTDKMSDVFEKLWAKYGEKDPKAKFVHNAKNISPSLTVSESGLTDKNVIQVLLLKYVKGAN